MGKYDQIAWCPHCNKQTDHAAVIGIIRHDNEKYRYYGFVCNKCNHTNYLGTPWLTPDTWVPVKWIDCPNCGLVTPHSDDYERVTDPVYPHPIPKVDYSYYVHTVRCLVCGNVPSYTEETENDRAADLDIPFEE